MLAKHDITVIILIAYIVLLTFINGILLYSVVATKQFDKGYSICLKQIYYQQNKLPDKKWKK